MECSMIKEVFAKAGVAIPSIFLEAIDSPDYDVFQSWCCGFDAEAVDNGQVVLTERCNKFRSNTKVFIVSNDGYILDREYDPLEC